MCKVPVSAVDDLSTWLESTLVAVTKDKDCKITGWIDGI